MGLRLIGCIDRHGEKQRREEEEEVENGGGGSGQLEAENKE